MSFAENLKQLRNEKQLSQEELAEMLDVSRQAVSKWLMPSVIEAAENFALVKPLGDRMTLAVETEIGIEIMILQREGNAGQILHVSGGIVRFGIGINESASV